ncbi:hypothetical protein BGZ83_002943, partial [Gryganskiella cystojenkinii]
MNLLEHTIPPLFPVTPEHSSILEEAWTRIQPVPEREDIEDLHDKTGLDLRVLYYWFQCRLFLKHVVKVMNANKGRKLHFPPLDCYQDVMRFCVPEASYHRQNFPTPLPRNKSSSSSQKELTPEQRPASRRKLLPEQQQQQTQPHHQSDDLDEQPQSQQQQQHEQYQQVPPPPQQQEQGQDRQWEMRQWPVQPSEEPPRPVQQEQTLPLPTYPSLDPHNYLYHLKQLELQQQQLLLQQHQVFAPGPSPRDPRLARQSVSTPSIASSNTFEDEMMRPFDFKTPAPPSRHRSSMSENKNMSINSSMEADSLSITQYPRSCSDTPRQSFTENEQAPLKPN